jgi:two-component system chemotaxis response regulator CheY
MSDILIIDDDADLRDLVRAGLEAMSHSVIEAADGKDGLARAKSSPFDLIISDMNMPNMTGWELLRSLKSDQQTVNIPVIALSAHQTPEDYDEAYREGCAAYIRKPVDLENLIDKVNDVLKG